MAPFIWADLVVSIAAERLNDEYYKTAVFALYQLLLAKLLKKKVVVFPSTFGPFFYGWSKWLTKKTLNRVDLIYARDKTSERILTQELEVPARRVVSSVDVAILQEGVGREEALGLLERAPQDRLIGVSAIRWSYSRNRGETPYASYDAYVREMAMMADTLISQYGVKIIFFPTNFRMHGCTKDDVAASRNIASLIHHKEKIQIVDWLPSPSQLQGMLSSCEINITTRMHACILSTNAGVPTISVNYLFKLKAYMESLGLSEFSIDIEEFCAERALTAFRKLWSERDRWRNHIQNRTASRRRRLWKSMEALHALL